MPHRPAHPNPAALVCVLACALAGVACARERIEGRAEGGVVSEVARAVPDEAFGPPPGYVVASVLGVHATNAGNVVLVGTSTDDGALVLPIFVGGTEALTIRLRFEGNQFARPLTHDLLGTLLAKLGARPVAVQIDELRGDTFVGTVIVRQGARVLEVDARPSDAIAVALGSSAPIHVSRALLEAAGIPKKDLDLANPDRNVPRPKDPIWL